MTLPNAPIAAYHRSGRFGYHRQLHVLVDGGLEPVPGPTATTRTGRPRVARVPRGSDGIASSLKSTPNSISYIEASFVSQAGAKAALINNGGGAVRLTSATTTAGLATAKVTGEGQQPRSQPRLRHQAPAPTRCWRSPTRSPARGARPEPGADQELPQRHLLDCRTGGLAALGLRATSG